MEFLGISESSLRLAAFLASFFVLSLAEAVWPRRPRLYPRRRRWPTNLLVMLVGAAAIRGLAALSLPLVAVATALWAERHQLGLLHAIKAPAVIEFGLTLLVFDLLIWGQHAAFHRLPWLWRWHRVHHVDRDIDASTALRFHPGEIVLSMVIKCIAVLALGAPAAAVVTFEILLNSMALFNHANLHLPAPVDRWLRYLVVTPDMHRVHHSVRATEYHRNFGFNLSIWDRCFSTYVAAPRDGHQGMRIGLPDYQNDAPTRLWWSLRMPLLRPPSSAAAEQNE